jgi:hypothetical protein
MIKKSGRITLRVSPRLHEDLADVARGLGTELNELLVRLVEDRLPTYRARALQQELEGALAPPPDDQHSLVNLAVVAGRGKEGTKRLDAMAAAVEPRRRPEDGLPGPILAAALRELIKEDEVREMDDAVMRYYRRQGREPPEGTLIQLLRGLGRDRAREEGSSGAEDVAPHNEPG